VTERRREADLRGALGNGEEAAPEGAETAPGAEAEAEPEPDSGAGSSAPEDYQLSRALDLLRGISLFPARAVN
jgi:carboxyl-terminal processing protease